MSFNESNTGEQIPTDLCPIAGFGLKWSNLVSVAKF
jgi:hypothetical protein